MNETNRIPDAAAPFAGSIVGWLASDHHGAPILVILIAITGGLFFGMLAAYGRSRDRVEAGRLAMFNAGALWVACFVIVFKGGFDFYMSAGIALGIGLAGAPFLEFFEQRILRGTGYSRSPRDDEGGA